MNFAGFFSRRFLLYYQIFVSFAPRGPNENNGCRMVERELGKLESVRGISPAYLQRAAFVAVLSFLFFLAMMLAFSLRRNAGYFLLATAFLFVQLLTLFGWLTQRRVKFKIYEQGFVYKNQTCRWDEIESMDVRMESLLVGKHKIKCEIKKLGGAKIVLTEAVEGIEQIVERIGAEIEKSRE